METMSSATTMMMEFLVSLPKNRNFAAAECSGLYGDRMFTTPSRQDQRYRQSIFCFILFILRIGRPDIRNRIGLFPHDRVSHSPLISPTPSSRDVSSRLFPARNIQRPRIQGSVYENYGGHTNFGGFPCRFFFSITCHLLTFNSFSWPTRSHIFYHERPVDIQLFLQAAIFILQ